MADLDITQDGNLTNETSPTLLDRLLFIKNSNSELRDIVPDILLQIVNLLTEDTAPTSSDFLLEYDASAGLAKKTKSTNLPVTDSKVAFTDITTGNASASNHGFLPKLSGSAGDVLRGDGTFGGLTGLPAVALKTADETVNNSSTLQNDDHLLFSAAANKIYRFDLYLILQGASGAGTDDIKFGWSAPVGCSVYWGVPGTPASAADGIQPTGTGTNPIANQGVTATPSYGMGNVTYLTKFEGIVLNGANAGTVNFQWAQSIAGARDLKVLTGSVLLYQLLN